MGFLSTSHMATSATTTMPVRDFIYRPTDRPAAVEDFDDRDNLGQDLPAAYDSRNVVLTAGENLAVGAAGGTLETCLLMPLLTWKFTVQEGRALPTKLTHWYRGVVVQAANVAPITALQMFANGVLERATTGVTGHGLTDGEKIVCACGAGVISSLAYTPVDYICIHQGKTGLGVAATIAAMSAEHGRACFWRGFNAMAVREGIYTVSDGATAPAAGRRANDDGRGSGGHSLHDSPLMRRHGIVPTGWLPRTRAGAHGAARRARRAVRRLQVWRVDRRRVHGRHDRRAADPPGRHREDDAPGRRRGRALPLRRGGGRGRLCDRRRRRAVPRRAAAHAASVRRVLRRRLAPRLRRAVERSARLEPGEWLAWGMCGARTCVTFARGTEEPPNARSAPR